MPRFARASFTLVEMLVAMVVLSLLLVLIFSVVGAAEKVSDSTNRGADSANEAKQILDRIGVDIAGMIIRSDVDQFYYMGDAKNTGENDKIFFYSESTGFFDSKVGSTNQTPVSFIGYRINANTAVNPAAPVLERLAQGLIVDSGTDVVKTPSTKMDPNATTGPLVFLAFNVPTSASVAPTLAPIPNGSIPNVWGPTGVAGEIKPDVGSAGNNYDDGTSPYYDAIGSQTFRFEVCFQHQDGTYSLYPGYTNSAPMYPASITNTVAIVVAIAVLDSKSRKLVPATSWTKMIKALPDPTSANLSASPPVLMDAVWNNALNQSTFAANAGIPPVTAAKIKVYQRYYPLNVPKTP